MLILVVYRRMRPLVINLVGIGIGITTALARIIVVFGELHVAALLFGTSLIGVSVDYGLYYKSSVFGPAGGTPRERLDRVMPGLGLGLLSTLPRYRAAGPAPLPRPRPIAAFSHI